MSQPATYQEWLLRYEYTQAAETIDKTFKPSRASMFIPADARAMSATTALRRGYNGKKPRDRTIALTDCLVTLADGSQYVMGKKAETLTRPTMHHVTAADLPAIGDSNH